jgi:hypothetical protein
MITQSTIKVIRKPKIEGKLVLQLTPQEAFMLGRIIGATEYDKALESCNDDLSCINYPLNKFTIDRDVCESFINTLHSSIYNSLNKV